MANFNTARLAEDIKREISTAMRDIKDGAVVKAMVGVSRCELTSDLSYCKVYITTLERHHEKCRRASQEGRGFL